MHSEDSEIGIDCLRMVKLSEDETTMIPVDLLVGSCLTESEMIELGEEVDEDDSSMIVFTYIDGTLRVSKSYTHTKK